MSQQTDEKAGNLPDPAEMAKTYAEVAQRAFARHASRGDVAQHLLGAATLGIAMPAAARTIVAISPFPQRQRPPRPAAAMPPTAGFRPPHAPNRRG